MANMTGVRGKDINTRWLRRIPCHDKNVFIKASLAKAEESLNSTEYIIKPESAFSVCEVKKLRKHIKNQNSKPE